LDSIQSSNNQNVYSAPYIQSIDHSKMNLRVDLKGELG
jgi:hypothetical protein